MAFATDYTWIYDQIRAKGASAYSLKNETRQIVMAENEGLTPDVIIQELQGILPNISGLVYLTISTKSKAEKGQGGKTSDLTIPINLAASPKAGAIQGIGNVPMQDNTAAIGALEEKFNAKLELIEANHKHALEVAELKRQLAEARETNPTIKMLEPHLPGIINGIFGGQPAAIAGVPETKPEAQELTQAEYDRATAALDALLKVDPDFITVLERLALMAQTMPQMYAQAKNMLPPLKN